MVCLGDPIPTTTSSTTSTTTTTQPPRICKYNCALLSCDIIHVKGGHALCFTGDTPSSEVRLEDGPNDALGRVQVRRNGVWGEICDDRWGQEDAQVICRMLCYKYATLHTLQLKTNTRSIYFPWYLISGLLFQSRQRSRSSRRNLRKFFNGDFPLG